jgi:hypothetical protein
MLNISAGNGHLVANNTLIGTTGTGGGMCLRIGSATEITVQNNAVSQCDQLVGIVGDVTYTAGGWNHNVYDGGGVAVGQTNTFVKYPGLFTGSLSAWRAACKCDADSVQVSRLRLASSGAPEVGSSVIAAGLNLGGLGIDVLNFDKTHLARPVIGAWDAGAIQSPLSVPNRPSGLKVVAPFVK